MTDLPEWALPIRDAMADCMFDILWPLQEWEGYEEPCRAASNSAATAALAEALPMVLTEVERHLSACQYDPAPYTCLKYRLRTLSDGMGSTPRKPE